MCNSYLALKRIIAVITPRYNQFGILIIFADSIQCNCSCLFDFNQFPFFLFALSNMISCPNVMAGTSPLNLAKHSIKT